MHRSTYSMCVLVCLLNFPAYSSDLSILLTSYSSIRRFVEEQAVGLGCLAARGVFRPSWIGLGWFYCSHFHLIHMKEFCILMKAETSHYVCLCAPALTGGEQPGGVSRCHSTDPLKRLHDVQDSDFRPMLLYSIDLSHFVS